MSENKYVLIETVNGDLTAELMRGLLQAQGIPAMLSKEGAARAMGLNVGPLGEVEILVPQDQLELARQVLEDYYAGAFANSEEFTENDWDGDLDELLDPDE